MKSHTVSISFDDDLLERIDRLALEEGRARSHLVREATRAYIQRREKWQGLFSYAEGQVERKGVRERDVAREIAKYRRGRVTE